MGKASKDKGAREERAVVAAWQCAGFAAERMPLSGAAGGSFTGDVTIPVLNDDRKIECKVSASNYKTIYDQLGDINWCLTIRRSSRKESKERLYVMRESDFLRLCIAAERASLGEG